MAPIHTDKATTTVPLTLACVVVQCHAPVSNTAILVKIEANFQ